MRLASLVQQGNAAAREELETNVDFMKFVAAAGVLLVGVRVRMNDYNCVELYDLAWPKTRKKQYPYLCELAEQGNPLAAICISYLARCKMVSDGFTIKEV